MRSTPTPAVAPLVISPCVTVSVHDGDTFRANVPLHYLWSEITGLEVDIRVAHVNAAELSTPNGKAAAGAVAAWLSDPANTPLTLHIYGREKYGRLLADAQTPRNGMLSSYVLSLPGSVPMSLAQLMQP